MSKNLRPKGAPLGRLQRVVTPLKPVLRPARQVQRKLQMASKEGKVLQLPLQRLWF